MFYILKKKHTHTMDKRNIQIKNKKKKKIPNVMSLRQHKEGMEDKISMNPLIPLKGEFIPLNKRGTSGPR